MATDPFTPYNDAIDYGQNQNDYYADVITRAIMGPQFFGGGGLDPVREHVPTPFTSKLLMQNQAFNQGAINLDNIIANSIIEQSQSPMQIIVDLQRLSTEDPTTFEQIIPKNEYGDPDWKAVQAAAQQPYDSYLTEQAQLLDPSIKEDPETGQFYKETPSELAQKFQNLGLPLPSEKFSDQAPPVGMAKDIWSSQRDMLGSDLNAAQMKFSDAMKQAASAAEAAAMGRALTPEGAAPVRPGLGAMSDVVNSGALAEGYQTGGVPGVFGAIPGAISDFNRATPGIGDIPDIPGVGAVTGAISDWWKGPQRGGGASTDSLDTKGLDLAAMGLNPDMVAPAMIDFLLSKGATDKAGVATIGDNKAENEMWDAKKAYETGLDQAALNAQGAFSPGDFSSAGAMYGNEDRGLTPLTATMGAMGDQFGIPNLGFTPTAENVGVVGDYAGGDQFQLTDPNNPNYRKNMLDAFRRATAGYGGAPTPRPYDRYGR